MFCCFEQVLGKFLIKNHAFFNCYIVLTYTMVYTEDKYPRNEDNI